MPATRDHYDVIVIGSGPGGASLAQRLAPHRQAHPDAGARRLPAAVARNWDSKTVFVDGAYQATETWYGSQGELLPSRPALLCRRQLQGLRRGPVPPARAGLRRAAAQGRHLPGLAARLRRVRALLLPGRGAVPRARPARRGPDGALVQRALRLSADHARAAHPAAERHPAARGPAPVPPAARHQAGPEPGRQRHHLQPLHPLRRVRRLSLRDQRQGRRAGDLRRPDARGAPELHPADRRLCHRLETDPAGRSVSRRARHPRRPGEQYSADIVVVACGALSSALLLLRSASDAHPNGLANGSGPGRAQLHAAQHVDRDGAAEGAEPHGVPEDAGAQRLLFRRRIGSIRSG